MKTNIKTLIQNIYTVLKENNEGNVATYIPQLANVDPNKLAISVCFVNGDEYNIGDFIIHHYDLFRLKNIKEINNIGLFENIEKNLTLIEWPEKIEKMIKKRISLFFQYENNFDRRFIKIQKFEKNEF